ncbi:MAG: amidohydrolase family protein [Rectinemataceae bacterium]
MSNVLIHAARIFDPFSGLDMVGDIRIEGGRIAGIGRVAGTGSEGDPAGSEVVEARGLFAVPGLIDIHAHVLPDLAPLCVDPDRAGTGVGVTTVCDAGSIGWANLDEAMDLLARRAVASEVLLFVHLAPEGEKTLPETGYDRWDRGAARAAIERHRDRVAGIKVRAVEAAISGAGIDVFATAADFAHGLGLPLMVHVGDKGADHLVPDALYAETTRILGLLGKGDILTHAYTPFPGGLFRDGKPIPGLEAAIARGVLLDASPGRGQFSFPVARSAIALGFRPDLAGTDTVSIPEAQPHFYNVAAILSKFMALGLSFSEVVAMATGNAAKAVGRADSSGSIAVGRVADLTLLRRERGPSVLHDGGSGNMRLGWNFLRPVATIRAGRLHGISTAITGHRVDPVAVYRQLRARKKPSGR